MMIDDNMTCTVTDVLAYKTNMHEHAKRICEKNAALQTGIDLAAYDVLLCV